MAVYARRYDWRTIDPVDNTELLDAFVAHPEFLTYPQEPLVARAIAAALVTDERNLAWATYSDQTLTGIIILTKIVPKVDALLHFLFLDQDLAGKRKLLKNVITHAFRDLGLNRLSMEVPEGVRLERFARKVLSFKLEGETRPRNPELPKGLSDNWVARQGSRREAAYFDGQEWKDVLLLRLLAREWIEQEGTECRFPEPSPQHSPSPDRSSADSSAEADPATPSPPSPETSSPSDRPT